MEKEEVEEVKVVVEVSKQGGKIREESIEIEPIVEFVLHEDELRAVEISLRFSLFFFFFCLPVLFFFCITKLVELGIKWIFKNTYL